MATTNPTNLDKVLALSTDTAKAEHGGAPNKKVTVGAALNVQSEEGGKTVKDGAEATVTLGTTHSETTAPATAS